MMSKTLEGVKTCLDHYRQNVDDYEKGESCVYCRLEAAEALLKYRESRKSWTIGAVVNREMDQLKEKLIAVLEDQEKF
jgi:hypothetical protein